MNNEKTLQNLASELKREFDHWDHILKFGGSDPFWADGMGLNLTRNHIISIKREMDRLVEQENSEPTLFPASLPDIFYRETPKEMSYDYMARADEIRVRANEQLALYENDPNFVWILEHHKDVYPKGVETKGTKAAGLSLLQSGGLHCYRRYVENDDLVSMRRMFWEPYEDRAPRWADLARKMKAYLEQEHSADDYTVVHDDYDEECGAEIEDEVEKVQEPLPAKRTSLDEQIRSAQSRAGKQEEKKPVKEEQMSLF